MARVGPAAINPWSLAGERNPAENLETVLESGEGALARNKAVVKRMVDFMSLHPCLNIVKSGAYIKYTPPHFVGHPSRKMLSGSISLT